MFTLIIIGFYCSKFTYNTINSLYLIYFFIGSGISFCTLAYKALNKYREGLEIVNTEKESIDKVLAKYKVTYTSNIEFGEQHHGIQEVLVELELRTNTLKRVTSNYKIDC